MRTRRSAAFGALALALALALSVALAAGMAVAASTAETLGLRATLPMLSELGACPSGITADACAPRTGKGPVPGLGNVTVTYTWSFRMGPPGCTADLGKPLATTGRMVVAGKGEIQFAVAEGARCIDREPLRNEPQDFTVTGGTGAYQGASGSGTLERAITAGRGTERWNGTLAVPGLDFDVVPPTLAGAKAKTVRLSKSAKRGRVTYAITANDARDGRVPVGCAPRSGSLFRSGRTVVTCSATDTSANTATARFAVTVRARR
jgi:hypothetical protein